MKTSKIKIVVSRSYLKEKSVDQPIVKQVAKSTEYDKNYYQKTVEALYEAIDMLSEIVLHYLLHLRYRRPDLKTYNMEVKQL